MATLILMRHAKAVDRMDAEDDFERGLTERGRSDAARAGEAMKAAELSADLALVSPSRRTRETWTAVADALGAPRVDDPMALYHASDTMLERLIIDALDQGGSAIALVGHNPGIGALAHTLAARAGRATAMPPGWPTSAVVAFDFTPGSMTFEAAELRFLFNPKT
ncbi:MAG: histidine phosphatase family protein [Pseudomonadota bacterium]